MGLVQGYAVLRAGLLVFSGHQRVRPVILVGLRKASDWLSFSWQSCVSRFCDAVVCRGAHLYYWARLASPKHPTSCFLAQSRELKNVGTTRTGKNLYFSFTFFPFLSFWHLCWCCWVTLTLLHMAFSLVQAWLAFSSCFMPWFQQTSTPSTFTQQRWVLCEVCWAAWGLHIPFVYTQECCLLVYGLVKNLPWTMYLWHLGNSVFICKIREGIRKTAWRWQE